MLFERGGSEQKTPTILANVGVIKAASTYSPTLKRAVPSAQAGLTSLFGMGRGGPCCYRHPKLKMGIEISDDRSSKKNNKV